MSDSLPYIIIILSLLPTGLELIDGEHKAPPWVRRVVLLSGLVTGLLILLDQSFKDTDEIDRDQKITSTGEGVDSLQNSMDSTLLSLQTLRSVAEDAVDTLTGINGQVGMVAKELNRAIDKNRELIAATKRQNSLLESNIRNAAPMITVLAGDTYVDTIGPKQDSVRVFIKFRNVGLRTATNVRRQTAVIMMSAVTGEPRAITYFSPLNGSTVIAPDQINNFISTTPVPLDFWSYSEHAIILIRLIYDDPEPLVSGLDTTVIVEYEPSEPNFPFRDYEGKNYEVYSRHLQGLWLSERLSLF